MAKEEKDDLAAVRILVDALSSFENSERQRIIRWACEKLGVPYDVGTSHLITSPIKNLAGVGELTTEGGARKSVLDIKSFIEGKDPQNDKQLAAVVAYYYAFEAPEPLRKTSINFQDLIEACRLSQKKRPTNAGQTLINAAHSGYLDKAEETGSYKLNAVGENLVAMTLPGGQTKRASRRVKKALSQKKAVKNILSKKRR